MTHTPTHYSVGSFLRERKHDLKNILISGINVSRPKTIRASAPGTALSAWMILVAGFMVSVASPGPTLAQIGSEAPESFTLEDLLRIGRERNPGLLALQAERAALDAGRRDAGRLPNPEFEFATGEGEPFGEAESRTVREFSISQALENPLVRHYRQGALKAGVEAAMEGVRFGGLQVDYAVRRHFYRILFLDQLTALARLNEEALSEVLDLMETRARVGEVRELEAIRLRVEHMRARNQVIAAELELVQERQHLDMFLDGALPEGFTLEGELTSDLRVPDLGELRESVLPGHPLLKQAANHRLAAENGVRAARFRWIPDPVFSASSARELDGDILSFGVGLEIPLWNQSRAATEERRQTLRQKEQEEASLLMGLEAELMVHHNHLLLHRQTLTLFQEGLLQEADASMEIADTSYREGEISLLEYLDARRTYQSIQIEYHQALYEWNLELTELKRSAGGEIQ